MKVTVSLLKTDIEVVAGSIRETKKKGGYSK